VIGNYRLLSEEEDKETYRIMKEIIVEHQESLLEGFRLYNNGKPYVSPAML